MQQKTKVKNEKIITDYIPPVQGTTIINENHRQNKLTTAELREKLAQQAINEMPGATKEKIDAVVFKRLYEYQHKQQEPEDPNLTLRPDMSRTLKESKERKYYHNGKYQKAIETGGKKGDKEIMAWSCCMNKGEASEGCVLVVKDKKKWILSSYT